MDLADFDLNDELSLEGAWVPISAKAKLKIARLNNENYRDYVKKQTKPYRSAMRAGSIDESLMTEIAIKAMARHILLDWEGLTDKGVAIPYSIEKAEEILRAKEPFRDLVASLANDQSIFQQAEVEDAEKNS